MGEGRVYQSPGLVPELARGEWGVCVPASCSSSDVEAALGRLAEIILQPASVRLDLKIPPLTCRTRAGPARPLRVQHYAFAIIIAAFIFLELIGTVWDRYCADQTADQSSFYRLVLRAFSLRVGWKRLTSERRDEVGCIAGLRTLSSIYMIFNHGMIYRLQEPIINKVNLKEMSFSNFYTPFMAGTILIETLFTVSGTVHSYSRANSIINGKFSYIRAVLERFIRLSPVYYLLILFNTSFLEYLGDGPNWPNFINYSVQTCRESWIWNFLYISNYASNFTLCVTPAWFLAAEMHFVILAPLALLPLFRWRRGRQLMLALIALSIVAIAAVIVFQRIPAVYQFYDTDRRILLLLFNGHTTTHMHFTSYLVGLYFGYILHKIKNKNIILNKGFLTLGWVLCVLIYLAIVVVANYMLQESYKYDVLESAAYHAIGRFLCAIAISWTIFACHTGYGGLLNKLLNCYPLLVMSRLSYIINIVQFVIVFHNGGRRRIPLWLDAFSLVEILLSDYMMSAIVSFVLFVLFDSPISIISHSFLFGGASKKMDESPPVLADNKNK